MKMKGKTALNQALAALQTAEAEGKLVSSR
jgi:hypothetical protein